MAYKKRKRYSFREISELHYLPLYKILKRKHGVYILNYKDRVFHKNMINGLCYGEFYGRNKIIYKRKSYLLKKKSKK